VATLVRAEPRGSAAPPVPGVEPARRFDLAFWGAVLLCTLALAGAVNATSLWIDEGFIAWVAGHGSLGALVEALRGPLPPADRQYPLYDFWILGWTHVFGFSEYALRAANLPFAALYVVTLAVGSRAVFARRFAWIPFALVPFMWFYVNEARSYCMLGALSSAAVAAVAAYAFGPAQLARRAPWLALPAILLAWLSNILAMFVFPGLLVLLVAGNARSIRAHWVAWRAALAVWILPLAAAAAYYAATLTGGAGSAEIANNQHRVSSAAGLLQALYELFGFAGLGPPRNELRALWGDTSWLHYAPWLAFGLLGFGVALAVALEQKTDRRALALGVAWAISCVLAFGVSTLLHARFLGRHLAALVPLAAFAGTTFFSAPVAVVAIGAVFVASDVRLSFLSEYYKDDYRSAVAYVCARNARAPGAIFWAADAYAAQYYGLDLPEAGIGPVRGRTPCASGKFVVDLSARDAQALVDARAARGERVYLVASKPDVFDIRGGWKQLAARPGVRPLARFRAFDIYEFDPTVRAAGGRASDASAP
jgi:hypothetical protein